MKTKILLALRELLIYLIIAGLIILAAYFLLRNYYPHVEVPEASRYSVLNRDGYKVVGDIQNEQNPTEIYATKTQELETDQTELRYIPGSVNPFVAQQGGSDLPTGYVGQSSDTESGDSGEPVETEEETEPSEDEAQE